MIEQPDNEKILHDVKSLEYLIEQKKLQNDALRKIIKNMKQIPSNAKSEKKSNSEDQNI